MSLGGDSFRWADIRWAEATTSFFEFVRRAPNEKERKTQNFGTQNAKRRKELGITIRESRVAEHILWTVLL